MIRYEWGDDICISSLYFELERWQARHRGLDTQQRQQDQSESSFGVIQQTKISSFVDISEISDISDLSQSTTQLFLTSPWLHTLQELACNMFQ